jgi:putative aminophosphonate oxidoreductase
MMRSLWLEQTSETLDDAPTLNGSEDADICIVGGGFTGLWTAIRLKELEPSLHVTIVEADVCGGGASGRNAGFVLTWWAKFGTLASMCGVEEALRLARRSEAALGEIHAFCVRHDIDAHYRPDGWLWTATNRAQIGSWRDTMKQLRAAGVEPFVELTPAEVARRAGSPLHLAGAFEPTAATIQPALLVRGLRRVALEQGVKIFEHSPMVALDRSQPPRVRTRVGSVSARRVVLAMNAWATTIRELRRSVAVVTSDIVVTDPIPDRLAELGLHTGVAISDSRMLVNYLRTTLDGRIAFGRGGGALGFGGRVGTRFDGTSPRAAEVTANFRELYPTLADVATPLSWTGPVDRSLTGLPFFGRLEGRADIVYAVGYSGNGVGPSYLGGRILSSLALGLDDEWTDSPLAHGPVGGFPPEPIRFLGGQLVRRAVVRKERADDANKDAGWLTRRLAGLAPTGLVPVDRSEPPEPE